MLYLQFKRKRKLLTEEKGRGQETIKRSINKKGIKQREKQLSTLTLRFVLKNVCIQYIEPDSKCEAFPQTAE
jgi:hypothetical protein